MLTTWIHWLSSLTHSEQLWTVLPLLCFDAPRYCLPMVGMWVWDSVRDLLGIHASGHESPTSGYRPSVCVVLVGLNEADTIGATLASVWNAYADMETIVVDDGSSDGMADVARGFAATHDKVRVLRKASRGGKSSALNFALSFTQAEIIICVDSDSELEPDAIERVVQPFADSQVGGAGGSLRARNDQFNLVTRLQAAEYRRSIFLGRILASRLGVLSILSGAFGAFRREALVRLKGWDVGPAEDGDLVFRLRKAGWRIVHVPYAGCLTNVPTTWSQLFNQRRRWEWAVVTLECRKHLDLANMRSVNFCLGNLLILLDTWTFRILLTFLLVAYLVLICYWPNVNVAYVLFTNYIAYLALDTVSWLVLLYYTNDLRRDLPLMSTIVIAPAYFLFLKLATLVAIVEEALWRRSYDDEYVPSHVRQMTWHW